MATARKNVRRRKVAKPKVVSRAKWLAARKRLLIKEKKFTKMQEDLTLARRSLPWVKIAKNYVFQGPHGAETLADLFEGSSQLIVYHFMFEPENQAGCKHCSLRADGFDGINVHLKHRDVTMIAVSRAPFDKLNAYKKRMGWGFKWVSSSDTDFNYDFGVSFTAEQMASGDTFYNFAKQSPGHREREGHSVFVKDAKGNVFHTYSCYSRGNEQFNIHYHYLDVVPKGRDENGRGPFWVCRHDEYPGPT